MNFTYERRINYYETDRMGVVHHSNYIRFLEEARCYMLDAMDIPYSALEESGIMIPVLGINLSFKQHVTFDDIIVITPVIKEFNGLRLTVNYTVTNKSTGNIVLTGETKHCFTDITLKPLRLQKSHPNIYDKFLTVQS